MRYRPNLAITASFCAASAAAAAWGWFDIGGLDAYHPGHATAVIGGAIGLLLGLPVLGSAIAVNRRVRAALAAPEGRWSVTPAQMAEFVEWQRRTRSENEWRPTAAERRHGIDVAWAGEDVVVGGHYWRIAPGQYPSITGVRLQVAPPASLALHYRQMSSVPISSQPRLINTDRVFRFPAPHDEPARAFARHFNHTLNHEDPRREQARLRRLSNWALGVGTVLLVVMLAGFASAWHDQSRGLYLSDTKRAVVIATSVFGIMGSPLLLLGGVAIRLHARRRARA